MNTCLLYTSCAETKGEHLKNDDSREKIALGQAWRTAAGKNFRYYICLLYTSLVHAQRQRREAVGNEIYPQKVHGL